MRGLKSIILTVILALCGAGTVFAKTYIVAVGVADYSQHRGKARNLRFTCNDANEFVRSAGEKLKAHCALLLDRNATKAAILGKMNSLFSQAGPDDQIIFFFSGHGYNGGFVSYDAMIPYADIRRAMANSRAGKKLIFADACMAGKERNEGASSSRTQRKQKTADVMLMLASRGSELSVERVNLKNGLFTEYLTRGLNGAADANGDRTVTAAELFNYVYKNVVKVSNKKQHPVAWGDFDSNMPIVKY